MAYYLENETEPWSYSVQVLFKNHVNKVRISYHLMLCAAEIFINLYAYQGGMSKLLAILKALINGEAKIDSVDKTPIDRTPGDVTELGHN